ncbi:MAG: phytoene desaturase family protein [Myxococcota bacterium]
MPRISRAVVIGAGLGGLAAALRLRARGYAVTVLEARDQAGGRAGVFRQDGFQFDAGPSVVTAPYLFDELWQLFGERREDHLTFTPVDPFYRVQFTTGEHFDYVGDEERILEEIRKFNPSDVDGYRRMVEHAKKIFEIGYLKLADVPFERLSDMLRVVPDMLRLKSHRSVYQLVSSYIQDDRLRQVFTFQPLLVGGNPFDTSSIYMLIHYLERKWGVHWARGGTAAIVQAMVDLLVRQGGELHLNTPVAEVEIQGDHAVAVNDVTGKSWPCDLVVANADPSVVYTRMISARYRAKHNDARVAGIRQSMSAFVTYFGTKKTYPDLKHHTIVLGPRYKGLLDDVFNRKVLADDFSLYLHAPTRSDPSMAPPGHEAFYALSPIPNNRSGIRWDRQGEAYQEKILESLEARLLPGLRDNIVTKSFIDTRFFAKDLRSYDGAAFGPQPLLTQSAWFRYHNRSEDVGGLYFVGAGTHPGAGMPGVLSSAKVLDRVIPEPDTADVVHVETHKYRSAM